RRPCHRRGPGGTASATALRVVCPRRGHRCLACIAGTKMNLVFQCLDYLARALLGEISCRYGNESREPGMRKISRTLSVAACMSAAAVAGSHAQEISSDAVTIGAIVDMSGVYSANGGQGAVVGAQMAIEDFGGEVLGKPIRLLSANYQNKVDVTNTIVREWIDNEDVDMVIESTDSASALAIQTLGQERGRLTIAAGSATTALTNDACTPLGIHYVYDTYALANGTGNAILRE